MSTFDNGFTMGFRQGRAHEELERERAAELFKPFRGNAPELLKPTRCRVLKSFWVGGKTVQPGEIIMLAKHDAESMRALRRVEAA